MDLQMLDFFRIYHCCTCQTSTIKHQLFKYQLMQLPKKFSEVAISINSVSESLRNLSADALNIYFSKKAFE